MSRPAMGLDGLRVLVIDDELLIALHLETLLEDLGCEVVGPAPTIETALLAIRDEAFDGVLLDANLDGVSSAPIAQALIERGIPFVVVTGYGALKLASAALQSAPRLSKPFNDAEFERTLATTFLV